MTSRPTLNEFRQHPHTISFCQVLVVHSKTWVCLLKDEKGRICYSKKEDATVKRVEIVNGFLFTEKEPSGRPVPGRTLIKFAYLGNGNELGSGNFFSSGLIYFRPFMRHKGCISSYWFAIFIQFLSWCCHCRKQTELLKNKSRLKIEH